MTAISAQNSITSHSQRQEIKPSNFFIACSIIGSLGICLAAIGLVGYGQNQCWWNVTVLSSSVGQTQSIILLAVGGSSGLVFLALSIKGNGPKAEETVPKGQERPVAIKKTEAKKSQLSQLTKLIELKPVSSDQAAGVNSRLMPAVKGNGPKAEEKVQKGQERPAAIKKMEAQKSQSSQLTKLKPVSSDQAAGVNFRLLSAEIWKSAYMRGVDYGADVAKCKIMRLFLGEEDTRDAFRATIAEKLHNLGVSSLEYIAIAYPQIAFPEDKALEKIAKRYRDKYAIELYAATLTNFATILEEKNGFVGLVISDDSVHVCSLLCYIEKGERQFLIFDPTYNEKPTNHITSILRYRYGKERVFSSRQSLSQADHYSCRTSALLFLRNALLDLKARPRKLSEIFLNTEDNITDLPPSWVASAQIYKQNQPLDPSRLAFREHFDEKLQFKCILFIRDISDLVLLAPSDVVLDLSRSAVIFDVSMSINTYVVRKGFQYLQEALVS